MRKHLLYLTNNQLTVRLWQRGRLSDGTEFYNDANGWAALSAYLSAFRHVPVYVLMDLIEEDFQRDTIPHVLGKTRQNLIDRRLLQLYRDTPYRHASRQGREKTGRKDDVMLFNALTNPALIKPWIDAISQQQVPIAGIFSCALLSELLFKKLALPGGPVLLITHQSSGLRQNFFYHGHLRFSRLIQLANDAPDSVADATIQEIARTRLFLANARLLQRGEALQLVALDHPDYLASLQQRQVESGDSTYRSISIEQASAQLGLKSALQNDMADVLMLALLSRTPPPSHYALPEKNNTYLLWQIRLACHILSAATLAGCLMWSGANALEAMNAAEQLRGHQQATLNNQHRYADVLAGMPKTDVNPHDMKAVVDVHALLVQNNATPNAILNRISTVLEHLPQLQLNDLRWEVSGGRDLSDPAAQPGAVPDAALLGLPVRPAETVTLKGEIVPFDGNYRRALQMVNQLVAELQQNQTLEVSVLHLPLDTGAKAALSGQAGQENDNPSAGFELKVSAHGH